MGDQKEDLKEIVYTSLIEGDNWDFQEEHRNALLAIDPYQLLDIIWDLLSVPYLGLKYGKLRNSSGVKVNFLRLLAKVGVAEDVLTHLKPAFLKLLRTKDPKDLYKLSMIFDQVHLCPNLDGTRTGRMDPHVFADEADLSLIREARKIWVDQVTPHLADWIKRDEIPSDKVGGRRGNWEYNIFYELITALDPEESRQWVEARKGGWHVEL